MPPPKILLDGDARLTAFADGAALGTGALLLLGWREWVALPTLGIAKIVAKVDTGARTSALHAGLIEPFQVGSAAWVRFDVTGEGQDAPLHEAPVADRRIVRSSNGEAEMRFVIATELQLAGRSWPIELTLTNRDRMELPMLIGREALAGRALVDADRSWACGKPDWRSPRRKPKPMARRRTSPGERT